MNILLLKLLGQKIKAVEINAQILGNKVCLRTFEAEILKIFINNVQPQP